MPLIYCDNFLNRFHAFVQLFRGLGESREYFLTYCCYCARCGEVVNCLESLRLSPKCLRALGVVVSVILKILVSFGNNCAFYFEIYLKYLNSLKYLKNLNCQVTLYTTLLNPKIKIRKFDTFLYS